jgi:hypothetical protein
VKRGRSSTPGARGSIVRVGRLDRFRGGLLLVVLMHERDALTMLGAACDAVHRRGIPRVTRPGIPGGRGERIEGMNNERSMLGVCHWLTSHPETIIVQPTSLCPLACTYCYLPQRHLTQNMSPSVTAAVAAGIEPDWPPVEIVWHGGEPLRLMQNSNYSQSGLS